MAGTLSGSPAANCDRRFVNQKANKSHEQCEERTERKLEMARQPLLGKSVEAKGTHAESPSA